MEVRVVYFEGCPNHESVVALVRHVAQNISASITLTDVKVETPEDAVRERMLGSPTVQVDGLDIETAARDRKDFAFSCRVFRGKDGLPPREMIAAALTGQEYDPSKSCAESGSEEGCCP